MYLLTSCGIWNKDEIQRIKIGEYKCIIQLPEQPEKVLEVTGHGVEFQYWFLDSSVVYITNSESVSSINMENLYEDREQYTKRKFSEDTLISTGFSNSLGYWEDRKLGCVSIGFAHVKTENLEKFRNALDSLRCP